MSEMSDEACSKTRLTPSNAPLTIANGNSNGIKTTHCINIDELNFLIGVECKMHV